MLSKKTQIEDSLQNARLIFNLKALEKKSKETQETIIWNWVKYIEYTFLFTYNQFSLSFLPSSFEEPGINIDDAVKAEINHLNKANDFLSNSIRYSTFGREEHSKQRWFNILMIGFLEKVLDRSHPFFTDTNYLKNAVYDEKYISRDFLFKYTTRKKLQYSASPKYLINGFKLLKEKGRIEIDSIENFVYSNFDFYSNKGYSIPPHKEDYSLKWLGVKGSFPQLLGQLKETKNIIATHEEIADFVLQYVKMQRSSALQYASLKEKLNKKNTIDIQEFRRL